MKGYWKGYCQILYTEVKHCLYWIRVTSHRRWHNTRYGFMSCHAQAIETQNQLVFSRHLWQENTNLSRLKILSIANNSIFLWYSVSILQDYIKTYGSIVPVTQD